ncbi:MAG: hypothetical protein HUU15_11190 [Candidatus Brocadiae bacterium]|nr:hypothetical protein [Candidatus Brocadiia bacterium]
MHGCSSAAPVPFYPGANLRHYAFLAQGVPDIAAGRVRLEEPPGARETGWSFEAPDHAAVEKSSRPGSRNSTPCPRE